jgi:hypothetical protein
MVMARRWLLLLLLLLLVHNARHDNCSDVVGEEYLPLELKDLWGVVIKEMVCRGDKTWCWGSESLQHNHGCHLCIVC